MGWKTGTKEPASLAAPHTAAQTGCDVDEHKNGRVAGGLSAFSLIFQTRLAMCASDIILQE